MKTSYRVLFVSALFASACAVSAPESDGNQQEVDSDEEAARRPRPAVPAPTCAARGGSCVGLSPSSCVGGTTVGGLCGSGVGVTCCIPGAAPRDSGTDASPAPTSCVPVATTSTSGAGVGVAAPWYGYCTSLGYTVDPAGNCKFPDRSSCEASKFYYGECGNAFSFCAKQGGSVASRTWDTGAGWTAKGAICTLSTGKTCVEQKYAQSCICDGIAP